VTGRRLATALVAFVVLLGAAPAAVAGGTGGDGKAKTVNVSEVELAPIPVGGGVVHATATTSAPGSTVPPTLSPDYEEVEYLFSGVADTYSGPATGPAEVASTGNEYTTRVIARFPEDPKDFSGRVFLEPFNTTSGPDRDVIWRQIAPLLAANGDAWVGVSVRSSSVDSLLAIDPVRYADLSIPLNDLEWDMLRQLGAVLRQGGEQSPLGKQKAEHLYMGGYSQSGVDTVTFAQAFHDTARRRDGSPIFDGYLPAAHAATMTPLQTGKGVITDFDEGPVEPVEVPVVDLETQHDVMGWTRDFEFDITYTASGGASVRRPDRNTASDKYRLYELAGASHSSGGSGNCGGTPSSFPNAPFVRAAAANLFAWAEDGTAPKKAPRIEMETLDTVSVPAVDEQGNALGGVRSPFVDTPLVTFQVQAGGEGLACAFSGIETPLTPEVLTGLYDDADDYLEQFTKSLDATIAAGYLLRSDRAELLEAARAKAATAFGG
jgi:hypothetical protein